METQSERDWEAHNDAMTLMQAMQIKADEPRHQRALDQIEKIKEEKVEELKALKKVK